MNLDDAQQSERTGLYHRHLVVLYALECAPIKLSSPARCPGWTENVVSTHSGRKNFVQTTPRRNIPSNYFCALRTRAVEIVLVL